MSKEKISHVGNHPERRSIWNPAEVVYAEQWEIENKRVPELNNGFGALELSLNSPVKDELHSGLFHYPISPITQRDAFVAATVIQWLGTNIGRCFMQKCVEKIEKEKEEYEKAQEVAIRMKIF